MIVSRSPKKRRVTTRCQMNPLNEDLIKVLEIAKKHERHIQFIVNAIKRLPSILSLFKQSKTAENNSIRAFHQLVHFNSSNQVSPLRQKSPTKRCINNSPSLDLREGEINSTFSNNSIQEILKFISKEMVLKYKDDNSVFLKYGDDCSEYMYIILQGEAALLSTIIKYTFITEEEFLLYLMQLRIKGEVSLLQLTYYENYPLYEKFLQHIHPGLEHHKLYNPNHNQQDRLGGRTSNAQRISLFFSNSAINFKETAAQFMDYFDSWVFSVCFKIQCELIVLKDYFNELISVRNNPDEQISEESLIKLHKSIGSSQDLTRILMTLSIEVSGLKQRATLNYYDSLFLEKIREFAFRIEDCNSYINKLSNKTKKSLLWDSIKIKFELFDPKDEIDILDTNLDEVLTASNEFLKEKPEEDSSHRADYFQSPGPKIKKDESFEKMKKAAGMKKGPRSMSKMALFKHGQNTMFSMRPMNTMFSADKYEEDTKEANQSIKLVKPPSIPIIINKGNLLMNDSNFHHLNGPEFEKKVATKGIFEIKSKDVYKPLTALQFIINAADLLDFPNLKLHSILTQPTFEVMKKGKQNNACSFLNISESKCDDKFERSNTPNIIKRSNDLPIIKYKLLTYQYAHHKSLGEKIGLMNTTFENSKYKSDFCFVFTQKSVLGLINKQKYFAFVDYLNSKLNVEDIKYFIKSPLFMGLSHEQFYKKYFKLFIFESLLKDDLIGTQKNGKFYFIKKGRISVSYEGSLRRLLGIIKQNSKNFNKTEQELYFNLINSKKVSSEFSDLIIKSVNWEDTMNFIDKYYDDDFKAYLDKPVKTVIQNIDCNFSFIVTESFLKYNSASQELKIRSTMNKMEGYSISFKDMIYIADGEIDVRKRLKLFRNEFFAATFKKLINLRDRLLEHLFEERTYNLTVFPIQEKEKLDFIKPSAKEKNGVLLIPSIINSKGKPDTVSLINLNLTNYDCSSIMDKGNGLTCKNRHKNDEYSNLAMLSTAAPVSSKYQMLTSKSALSIFKPSFLQTASSNKTKIKFGGAIKVNSDYSIAISNAFNSTRARNRNFIQHKDEGETLTNLNELTASARIHIPNIKRQSIKSGYEDFKSSVPLRLGSCADSALTKRKLISDLSKTQNHKLALQMPWSLIPEKDKKEKDQNRLKREIEKMFANTSTKPKDRLSKDSSAVFNKDNVSRYNCFVRNFQKSSKLKTNNYTSRFLSNSNSLASVVTRTEKIKNLILNS